MKAYTTKTPAFRSRVLAEESAKLTPGTISARSMQLGIEHGEPLALMFESLLRYAAAYELRFHSKLATDYVLGPKYLDALTGVRGLLDGDGAVAMERGITTDSKDNGTLEAMFWHCMKASGFTEADI
jgi:hypothetical protein